LEPHPTCEMYRGGDAEDCIILGLTDTYALLACDLIENSGSG
jgi:hypothetical protein